MRIIVTAGPTREYLDPVRFLSNPSTGKMGFAIAAEAARRGHEVVLVAGPVALKTPKGVAVNLYTEATYRTDGLTLEMKTRYPEDGAVEIVTEAKRPLELKLRIPRWSEEPDAGSWRVVRLGEGRQVTKLAFRLRDRLVRGTGEQSGKVALVRGPVVFAQDRRADGGETGFARQTVPVALFGAKLTLVDFASAGSTWDDRSRYRVWLAGEGSFSTGLFEGRK